MADSLITGTTIIESSSKSDGDVPIGGMIPWLSNITGVPNLPVGWKLCDGTAVNDALSPMNGQTIPDLNGDNRFVRGSDTAGGTGGSATSAHTHSISNAGKIQTSYGANIDNYSPFQVGVDSTAPTVATQSTSPSILPTYINVVWIIRIR
jgi:hypothetical protein|tara:strand:+ start:403 stop:852 length:450 start_codon:yes stop_codon:yes gene_type:complete